MAGGGAGVAHALASLTLTPILGLAAGVQAAARAPRVRSMPRGEFWARVAWASIPNALSFLALEVSSLSCLVSRQVVYLDGSSIWTDRWMCCLETDR